MGRAGRLLAALRYRPIAGVTCRGKTDGGGAQIHAIMSAQVFAREANVRYFHTPLSSVSHGPSDHPAWSAEWESIFGLGVGHELVPENLPVVSIDEFLGGYKGALPIVEAPFFHDFRDQKPDRFLPLLDDFRSRCRLVSDASGSPYAAVHIRRGDVALPGSKFANRLTPIEAVARTVSIIRKARPELAVYIYSQGSPEDFSALPSDCVLHLDTDVFDTLSGMINAHLLVTAKSSFSYVAALLSHGFVLYQPYSHDPLSAWIVLSPNGEFNPAAIGEVDHPR